MALVFSRQHDDEAFLAPRSTPRLGQRETCGCVHVGIGNNVIVWKIHLPTTFDRLNRSHPISRQGSLNTKPIQQLDQITSTTQVIVDDQCTPASIKGLRRQLLSSHFDTETPRESKDCPLTRLAFQPDLAIHQLHQAGADRQPQTSSTKTPCGRHVGL